MPVIIANSPERFIQALNQLGPNARCTVSRNGANGALAIEVSNDFSFGALRAKLSSARRAQEGLEVANVLKRWADAAENDGNFFKGFGREHLTSSEKIGQRTYFRQGLLEVVPNVDQALVNTLRLWELRTLAAQRHLGANTRLRNIDGLVHADSVRSLDAIIKNIGRDQRAPIWNKRIFSEMTVEDYIRAKSVNPEIDHELPLEETWDIVGGEDLIPQEEREELERRAAGFSARVGTPDVSDPNELEKSVDLDEFMLREKRELLRPQLKNLKDEIASLEAQLKTARGDIAINQLNAKLTRERLALHNFMHGFEDDLKALGLHEEAPNPLKATTPAKAPKLDANAVAEEYYRNQAKELKKNITLIAPHYEKAMADLKGMRPMTNQETRNANAIIRQMRGAQVALYEFMNGCKDDLLKLGLYEDVPNPLGSTKASISSKPQPAPTAGADTEDDGFVLPDTVEEQGAQARTASPDSFKTASYSDEEISVAVANAKTRSQEEINVADMPEEEVRQKPAMMPAPHVVANVLAPAPRAEALLADSLRLSQLSALVKNERDNEGVNVWGAHKYSWQHPAFIGLNPTILRVSSDFAGDVHAEAQARATAKGIAVRDAFVEVIEEYKGIRGQVMFDRLNAGMRANRLPELTYSEALTLFQITASRSLFTTETHSDVVNNAARRYVDRMFRHMQPSTDPAENVGAQFMRAMNIPVETSRDGIFAEMNKARALQQGLSLEATEFVVRNAMRELLLKHGYILQ